MHSIPVRFELVKAFLHLKTTDSIWKGNKLTTLANNNVLNILIYYYSLSHEKCTRHINVVGPFVFFICVDHLGINRKNLKRSSKREQWVVYLFCTLNCTKILYSCNTIYCFSENLIGVKFYWKTFQGIIFFCRNFYVVCEKSRCFCG